MVWYDVMWLNWNAKNNDKEFCSLACNVCALLCLLACIHWCIFIYISCFVVHKLNNECFRKMTSHSCLFGRTRICEKIWIWVRCFKIMYITEKRFFYGNEKRDAKSSIAYQFLKNKAHLMLFRNSPRNVHIYWVNQHLNFKSSVSL